MALYVISAVTSFAASFVLAWWLKTIAARKQIFCGEIRPRDVHTTPTPRVGGIAIVVTFLLVALSVYLLNPDWLSFTRREVWGIDSYFLGLILSVMILTVVNIADDYKSVSWPVKLLTQILAAVIIALFGVKVGWLTTFGWELALSGALSMVFIVVWLVSLANVVNWLDSVDGLVGGVSLIALAILFLMSLARVNFIGNAVIGAIAFGAVAGFLPHNFMSKKAFLGDTGAVFLGFLIGVMAIISGGKVTIAFLILALPILDAAVVFFSRLFSHSSPFLPDQRHLPHRLLAMGLKVWQVDLTYYIICLTFGLIALNTQLSGRYYAMILAAVVMATFVLLYSRQAKEN